jgi:hypothetical protein
VLAAEQEADLCSFLIEAFHYSYDTSLERHRSTHPKFYGPGPAPWRDPVAFYSSTFNDYDAGAAHELGRARPAQYGSDLSSASSGGPMRASPSVGPLEQWPVAGVSIGTPLGSQLAGWPQPTRQSPTVTASSMIGVPRVF